MDITRTRYDFYLTLDSENKAQLLAYEAAKAFCLGFCCGQLRQGVSCEELMAEEIGSFEQVEAIATLIQGHGNLLSDRYDLAADCRRRFGRDVRLGAHGADDVPTATPHEIKRAFLYGYEAALYATGGTDELPLDFLDRRGEDSNVVRGKVEARAAQLRAHLTEFTKSAS